MDFHIVLNCELESRAAAAALPTVHEVATDLLGARLH